MRLVSTSIPLTPLMQHLRLVHPTWDDATVAVQAQHWIDAQQSLDDQDQKKHRNFHRRQSLWEDPHLAIKVQEYRPKPGPGG